MPLARRALFAIATNGLHRAAGEGVFAEAALFVRFRLLVEVGVATVIIALEVGGRCLAAEVAVNALVIDIVRAGNVLGVFVCSVCHGIWEVRGGNTSSRPRAFKRFFGPGQAGNPRIEVPA